MSRVNEEQQQKRAEMERMQKTADKQAREAGRESTDRAQFGQVLKQQVGQQSQQTAQQGKLKDAKEQTSQMSEVLKKGAEQLGREAAMNARLARGGAVQHSRLMQQAESFHSLLDGKRTETDQLGKVMQKDADESKSATTEAIAERHVDLDQKAEDKRETAKKDARLEAGKKGVHNAAIDGEKRSGKDDTGGRGDEAGIEAAKSAGLKNEVQASEVQGAAGAKQLPPEVVEALVKQVMIGVNEKGDHVFRIELRDGVLQGATLQITAKNGKIGIDVGGLDDNARRLMQASVGSLQRGLAARGLALDHLTVS